jgi:uncharacterized protein
LPLHIPCMIALVDTLTSAELSIPSAIPEPYRTILTEAAMDWVDTFGPRLVSLVLFGSVARGESREASDIDLLVVARDLPRSAADRRRLFLERWREVRSAKSLAAPEWNLIVKSPKEAEYHSPLYLDMTEDAVRLFDRGGFFGNVLDAMRERMKALGSRRKYLPDGTWYWDLKPDFRYGEDVEL